MFNQSRAIRGIGMISKGKNPTALELKWRGIVADFADNTDWLEANFGGHNVNTSQYQFDHFLGAQTKRKPFGRVGEFAIIPIPIKLHERGGSHKLNRTENKKAFDYEFGTAQYLFEGMIYKMRAYCYEIPFSQDIINAIVRG